MIIGTGATTQAGTSPHKKSKELNVSSTYFNKPNNTSSQPVNTIIQFPGNLQAVLYLL
jgi:hypothetical protein